MNLEIRRVSGVHEYPLIREETVGRQKRLVLYENTEPIWGGKYAVSLLSKFDTEEVTKNGLCLDAAIEVFNKTLKLFEKWYDKE